MGKWGIILVVTMIACVGFSFFVGFETNAMFGLSETELVTQEQGWVTNPHLANPNNLEQDTPTLVIQRTDLNA